MAQLMTNDQFVDLEARLNKLRGQKITIKLSNLDSTLANSVNDLSDDRITGYVSMELQQVFRNDYLYGIALIGKDDKNYWRIGTHSPFGYVSRIRIGEEDIKVEGNPHTNLLTFRTENSRIPGEYNQTGEMVNPFITEQSIPAHHMPPYERPGSMMPLPLVDLMDRKIREGVYYITHIPSRILGVARQGLSRLRH